MCVSVCVCVRAHVSVCGRRWIRNRSVFDRTIWRKLPQCFLVTAYNINCSTAPPSCSSGLVSPPRPQPVSFQLHLPPSCHVFPSESSLSPPARSRLACSYLAISLSLKVLPSLPSPKTPLCLINTSVTYLVALNFLKQTLQQLPLTPSLSDIRPFPRSFPGMRSRLLAVLKTKQNSIFSQGRNASPHPPKNKHIIAWAVLPRHSCH